MIEFVIYFASAIGILLIVRGLMLRAESKKKV